MRTRNIKLCQPQGKCELSFDNLIWGGFFNMHIYPTPLPPERMSISKRSELVFNSVFLLLDWLPFQSSRTYSTILGVERRDGFKPFLRASTWSETQTELSESPTRSPIPFLMTIAVMVSTPPLQLLSNNANSFFNVNSFRHPTLPFTLIF